MAEYINREALIAKFSRMLRVKHGTNERFFADSVFAIIENFPAADAVPVVRCKYCKYFKTPLCQNEDNHDNWFCADGEQKDEVSE